MGDPFGIIKAAIHQLEVSTGPKQRDIVYSDLHVHLIELKQDEGNLVDIDVAKIPIHSVFSWPLLRILTLKAFQEEICALVGSPDLPGVQKSKFQVLSMKIQPNTMIGNVNGSNFTYLNFDSEEDLEALGAYWTSYLRWLCALSNHDLYGVNGLGKPSIEVTVRKLSNSPWTSPLATPQMILSRLRIMPPKIPTPCRAVSNSVVTEEACRSRSATTSVASDSVGMSSLKSPPFNRWTVDPIALAKFVRRFDASRAFAEDDDKEFYPGAL